MVSLFDILGPVMVGPSSSHTAGACRLGLMARAILGGTPERARIGLHGSFAATGEGHGTHRALVGGLIGCTPDDLRLREAFEHARTAGLEWTIEEVELGDDAHPNTAVFELERGEERLRVAGSSVGGGRIEISEIDGFAVALTGAYPTVVILADDVPGTVATITGIFADSGVNVATMRVDRTGRHKKALMTIETDQPIPAPALAAIRSHDWLDWARAVTRVA
jgi:L-serine dehydratase